MQSSRRQLPSRSVACAVESLVCAPSWKCCDCPGVSLCRRDRGLTAPGIAESIKVSACHCVFVCRLSGLVVPVGRDIELTIDRLALRDMTTTDPCLVFEG